MSKAVKTPKAFIPKGPTLNFVDDDAQKTWQDFGTRNATPQGHLVQDYARTLMFLMQGFLEEKPTSTVKHAVNFAMAEASTNGLTYEQKTLAQTLIANCWIHGKQFADAVNA